MAHLQKRLHKNYFLIIALAVHLVPKLAFGQSEQIAQLRSSKVRNFVTASANYLKENSVERRSHLPQAFRFSEMGSQVATIYQDRSGQPHATYLHTKLNTFVDMGRVLTWREDSKNIQRVYTKIYSILPRRYTKKLKAPKVVRSGTLREQVKAFNDLALMLDQELSRILVDINPDVLDGLVANPIGSCTLEEGYTYFGSDSESSERCDISEYATDGLFRQLRFPLRDKLTCIRDQSSRGTCTSHAIAAALETIHLTLGGNPQTLSEQDIYYHSELYGDSQINTTQMQLYGNAIEIALDTFVRQRFGIYFESDWGYNTSPSMQSPRIDVSNGLYLHPNSCSANYFGRSCADNVWQTAATTRAYGVPNAASSPTASEQVQHRITSNSYLPGIGAGAVGAESSLQQAIVLLAAGVPVIASMDITDSFARSSRGYIRDVLPDPVRGGHTVLLVGFIRNQNLPTGVTPATEEGYFIAKNSWGIEAGDCGFYYLDFRYVKRRLYYLNFIDE